MPIRETDRICFRPSLNLGKEEECTPNMKGCGSREKYVKDEDSNQGKRAMRHGGRKSRKEKGRGEGREKKLT